MTRKEAIAELKRDIELENDFTEDYKNAVNMAIKALEQEPILDKIRAEIEELHLIGYATVDGKREIASRAVMQIIDKYKAESEDD